MNEEEQYIVQLKMAVELLKTLPSIGGSIPVWTPDWEELRRIANQPLYKEKKGIKTYE